MNDELKSFCLYFRVPRSAFILSLCLCASMLIPLMAQIILDGKYGFVDKSGKTIIQPQFEWTGGFSEGLALITDKRKYGYIDRTGAVVIQPQFDNALPFSEGVAKVWVKGKHGYIDKSGNFIWKTTK